jgi:DNA polymerase-3 subunit alpha (Gram-positive type)
MQQQISYDLINNLSFCVFDLETTGGNQNTDKIIEIGLVRIESLKIVSQKSFLIRPEVHIPEFIQKLTNIKEADVQNAPLIEEVIDEVLEFMGDAILVAHNTSFDIPFFNSVLTRLGKEKLQNKAICTNLMTKYMIPNLLSSNLHYMSKIFDLTHQKAHRALDDSMASAELLLKFLNIFIDKEIHKVNSLYYPKNKFELDRVHFKKNIPLTNVLEKLNSLKHPFLITLKGIEGVVLFSFPSLGSAEENNFIINKIKSIPYEILTIKLTGPYFQGLIEMFSFYSKLPEWQQTEIIENLYLFNQIAKPTQDIVTPPADFIIMNHLIPEQFVIFPLESLHQKMELVFRYPTHQNKLIQFLNTKSLRISQHKLKIDVLPTNARNFIYQFLTQKMPCLLLSKVTHKFTTIELESLMENFIKEHPNNYEFPQNYL